MPSRSSKSTTTTKNANKVTVFFGFNGELLNIDGGETIRIASKRNGFPTIWANPPMEIVKPVLLENIVQNFMEQSITCSAIDFQTAPGQYSYYIMSSTQPADCAQYLKKFICYPLTKELLTVYGNGINCKEIRLVAIKAAQSTTPSIKNMHRQGFSVNKDSVIRTTLYTLKGNLLHKISNKQPLPRWYDKFHFNSKPALANFFENFLIKKYLNDPTIGEDVSAHELSAR